MAGWSAAAAALNIINNVFLTLTGETLSAGVESLRLRNGPTNLRTLPGDDQVRQYLIQIKR